MKKRYLVLFTLPLLFSSLTGCSKKKERLTYGTFVSQTIFTLKEIDTATLYAKSHDENEVFLLATYQGGYSEDCGCWNTFENVIAKYMNNHHERVYVYNTMNIDDSVSNLKITKYEDSTPGLYIFNGEKQLAKFAYNNSKDKNIFSDLTTNTMYKSVHNYIEGPLIFDVDEAFLNEKLSVAGEAVIVFAREKCGDCQYVLPNVLIPYIKERQLAKNVWLFDMQKQYELSKSETASEEEKGQYQALKDRYGLSESGNATFGYQNGVVPTIQYYQKGVLKDAAVYFNDVIEQKGEDFYISDSFYTEERLQNINYLRDCDFTTVLKGLKVTQEVVQTKTGDYYWAQENAAKYHTPILKAFLDTYLLELLS